ncbi:MAG: Uma2 family endonuclease, partial [Caldilineaceae bacterium SB0665_bin_21]|nr:Uma2 family endonuclease [Caldilineaceae bacterium SB0665_bin_21]
PTKWHPYIATIVLDWYYIDLEVRLSPTPEHSVFLDRAGRNLETFLELRGRHCPITREVPIQDLEALPAYPGLARSRYRIEPDLAMWPPGTVIAPDRAVSWREQGAPLLVLECLSPSTEAKDREDNPVIYDLMGVAEYWICSPSDRHPMFGYQRTDAGEWISVGAGANREAWSQVLQTRIRTDPVHGFQCQNPATGNWVDMERHFQAKGVEIGRAEGMEIGKAEGKREVLLELARSLHPMPAEYEALVRELDQTPWTEWPDTATVLQRFQR